MTQPQQPLDYQNPRQRTRPRHAIGQCIATALLMAAIVVVGTFVFFLLAFSASESGHDSGALGTFAALASVGILGLSNFLAYRAYRVPERRHLALGIWIGLGLGLLIEGACFAMAMR